MVAKVCPGFLDSPKHLEGHFYYLTDTKISLKVEQNLEGHLGWLN